MEDNLDLKKAFFEDVLGLPRAITILLTVSEDEQYFIAYPKSDLKTDTTDKFGPIMRKAYEFNGEYLHDESGRGYFRFRKKF